MKTATVKMDKYQARRKYRELRSNTQSFSNQRPDIRKRLVRENNAVQQIYFWYLTELPEDEDCFEGLPPFSIKKPAFNDVEFMSNFALVVKQGGAQALVFQR